MDNQIKQQDRKKLSVLLSFSGAGGVERMVMNLVREFAKRPDIDIDLLMIRAKGPHLRDIPDNVRQIELKAGHTLTAVPELKTYLKTHQPDAMLVAKDRAGRAALMARKLAKVDTRIVIRLGTNLSTALEHKSALSRWWRTAPMRVIYPWVDKVIAVSEGVRQDTLKITGIAENKVTVVRNPVITDSMLELPTIKTHDWLDNKTLPVVMGAGRLSKQKDFATLLSAFAKVVKEEPCRLIILGDGSLRADLEIQLKTLQLKDKVSLPGFQSSIYSWLKQADLFVLSSRWEGSPNVLTEALALGVPSVSTRCPSGPNEVLAEGKYGELVPVGDVDQLAAAMLKTLRAPHSRETLQEAVAEYRSDISAKHYLQLLLGDR
ncbi:glycosyltransferase [Leucothrix mucor]|uniref:glycosyltransferase n=1 Tax=Leucothrix mucor TaxID=45248 RepID=UPI0003B380AA|nr:glycosyltransferase [Leucothrix mucor]